jgi:hypothetical protein
MIVLLKKPMKHPLQAKYKLTKGNSSEVVWWDPGIRVGRNIMVGTFDDEQAEWVYDKVTQITSAAYEPVNWLVDISELKTASRKARKIMRKMDQLPKIYRIAFLGGPPFARAITNFITKAAGKDEIKHFSNEEDALSWLNE